MKCLKFFVLILAVTGFSLPVFAESDDELNQPNSIMMDTVTSGNPTMMDTATSVHPTMMDTATSVHPTMMDITYYTRSYPRRCPSTSEVVVSADTATNSPYSDQENNNYYWNIPEGWMLKFMKGSPSGMNESQIDYSGFSALPFDLVCAYKDTGNNSTLIIFPL